MKVSDLLQVLIAADQLMGNLSRLVGEIKLSSKQDENTLRTQLVALRERNDARFKTTIDLLEKRAGEQ